MDIECFQKGILDLALFSPRFLVRLSSLASMASIRKEAQMIWVIRKSL